MDVAERLDALRSALERAGVKQAVITDPQTLAYLGCFERPDEDWPVANPFVAVPALLCVSRDDAVLIVADFHRADVRADDLAVVAYRSYDFERPPNPAGELEVALLRTLDETGFIPGPTGVEAQSIPYALAAILSRSGHVPVACDAAVETARRLKGPLELQAIRRASRLADVAQQAIKDHAAPGVTEAELAGLAALAMFREAGRRLPAILTVSAGPEATATGGGTATKRVVAKNDLVLTDTSPWIDGAWSDSANTVLVGKPDAATRRRFDAVRRALHEGIELCRPGAVARDIDSGIRARLADEGPTYAHHTGHGIGAAWSEEPRITPYNDLRIEEGMVLALEPAIYLPGWGGIRLEHVFVVRSDGNEILTQFEHTL